MTFSKSWSIAKGIFPLCATLALISVQSERAYGQDYLRRSEVDSRLADEETQITSKDAVVEDKQQTDIHRQVDVAAPKQSTSEIWAALLLGNSSPRVAKPQFAFSHRRNSSKNLRALSPREHERRNSENTRLSSNALPFTAVNDSFSQRRKSPSLYDSAIQSNDPFSDQGGVYPTDASDKEREKSISDVRRKIEELDKYLAANSPTESNKLAQRNLNAAETATAYQQRNPIRQVNGETLKKQNNGIRSSVFEEKLPSRNRGNQEASPRKVEINRREFSDAVFTSRKQSSDSNVRDSLPVRPNALQISNRSFISTEIVRLPAAGSLSYPQSKTLRQTTSKKNMPNVDSSTSENKPTFVHPELSETHLDSNTLGETTRRLNPAKKTNAPRANNTFVTARDI